MPGAAGVPVTLRLAGAGPRPPGSAPPPRPHTLSAARLLLQPRATDAQESRDQPSAVAAHQHRTLSDPSPITRKRLTTGAPRSMMRKTLCGSSDHASRSAVGQISGADRIVGRAAAGDLGGQLTQEEIATANPEELARMLAEGQLRSAPANTTPGAALVVPRARGAAATYSSSSAEEHMGESSTSSSGAGRRIQPDADANVPVLRSRRAAVSSMPRPATPVRHTHLDFDAATSPDEVDLQGLRRGPEWSDSDDDGPPPKRVACGAGAAPAYGGPANPSEASPARQRHSLAQAAGGSPGKLAGRNCRDTSPAKPPATHSRSPALQGKRRPAPGCAARLQSPRAKKSVGAGCGRGRLRKVVSMMAAPGYIAASFAVRPPPLPLLPSPPYCMVHPCSNAVLSHSPPPVDASALQRHG